MFQIATTVLAISTLASATVMHVVTVGQNGLLQFCPEQITADAGDLVQFQFYPKVPHLSSVFANTLRTIPSRKGSLPKAAHPFQTPHLVPHSKVSPFLQESR
jgi:plastocyanin